jgi:hypothetical protein
MSESGEFNSIVDDNNTGLVNKYNEKAVNVSIMN